MSTILEDCGLEEHDTTGLHERMESGGQVPPGFYPATLDGAKRIESKQKGTPGIELTFKVGGTGPFAGSRVTDTLWIGDKPKSKDRITLFGSRLGLFAKDPATGELKRNPKGGPVLVPGKTDFIDCLDVSCVIEVVSEEYDRDDGTKGHSARLAFGGIHDPADPKTAEKMAKAAAGGDKAAGANGSAKKADAGTTAAATATREPAKKERPKPDLSEL